MTVTWISKDPNETSEVDVYLGSLCDLGRTLPNGDGIRTVSETISLSNEVKSELTSNTIDPNDFGKTSEIMKIRLRVINVIVTEKLLPLTKVR